LLDRSTRLTVTPFHFHAVGITHTHFLYFVVHTHWWLFSFGHISLVLHISTFPRICIPFSLVPRLLLFVCYIYALYHLVCYIALAHLLYCPILPSAFAITLSIAVPGRLTKHTTAPPVNGVVGDTRAARIPFHSAVTLFLLVCCCSDALHHGSPAVIYRFCGRYLARRHHRFTVTLNLTLAFSWIRFRCLVLVMVRFCPDLFTPLFFLLHFACQFLGCYPWTTLDCALYSPDIG